ncbi:MAG: NDP-sugar synthase [Candidatus Lokiarchaeota archaeon]|nr:NDP-sugar synthase [Candidatus Lokiarchaeota archaeon]
MPKAIILSGGWGTRLRPLTCTIPKTLIPICNKPVMERQILLLKAAGVTEIVLAVSVMADVIKDYFKEGEKLGIKISYTDEIFPAGTAGAIKLAEDILKDDNFFMLNGDVILNFDFSRMLQFHIKSKAFGTIASKIIEDPSHYGVIIANQNTNKIEKFLEKEEYKPPTGGFVPMPINSGVYLLEPEILSYIPSNKKVSIEREVFPKITEEREVYHYPIEGIWKDIGKPYDLLQGNISLMNDLIQNLSEEHKSLVDYSAQINPTSKIIHPCVIGEKTIIRQNCIIGPNAIIGDNVFIDDNCVLKNSIIYNESYISNNVEIENAIISDNCAIGDNAHLKGIEDKLILLSSYVKVMKGVKIINDFNDYYSVCHHEVVSESLKK